MEPAKENHVLTNYDTNYDKDGNELDRGLSYRSEVVYNEDGSRKETTFWAREDGTLSETPEWSIYDKDDNILEEMSLSYRSNPDTKEAEQTWTHTKTKYEDGKEVLEEEFIDGKLVWEGITTYTDFGELSERACYAITPEGEKKFRYSYRYEYDSKNRFVREWKKTDKTKECKNEEIEYMENSNGS